MDRTLKRFLCVNILMIASLLPSCESSQTSRTAKLMEAWDNANAPRNLLRDYQTQLSALPLSSASTLIPWTDTYWPSYQGGIAYRWQTYSTPFEYETYSQEELMAADGEVLKALSPAEKFDVLREQWLFPLTNAERNRTDPENPGWFGLCHGWAAASVNFKEPAVTEMPAGLPSPLPFGSSDIKALLTYAQQLPGIQGSTDFLGLRCNTDLSEEPEASDSPYCKGVNAGSFHIILANMLGLEGKPLIMDLNRGYQVWNFPIYNFSSNIRQRDLPLYDSAAEGTSEIIEVETILNYISERGPFWEKVGDQNIGQSQSQSYVYTLELDQEGQIIGGEWQSESRPDFMWRQDSPHLVGSWQALQTLYDKSIAEVPTPDDGDNEEGDEEGGDTEDEDGGEDNDGEDHDDIVRDDPVGGHGLCQVSVSCVQVGDYRVLYTDAYDGRACATGSQCPNPPNLPILGAWGECRMVGREAVLTRNCERY